VIRFFWRGALSPILLPTPPAPPPPVNATAIWPAVLSWCNPQRYRGFFAVPHETPGRHCPPFSGTQVPPPLPLCSSNVHPDRVSPAQKLWFCRSPLLFFFSFLDRSLNYSSRVKPPLPSRISTFAGLRAGTGPGPVVHRFPFRPLSPYALELSTSRSLPPDLPSPMSFVTSWKKSCSVFPPPFHLPVFFSSVYQPFFTPRSSRGHLYMVAEIFSGPLSYCFFPLFGLAAPQQKTCPAGLVRGGWMIRPPTQGASAVNGLFNPTMRGHLHDPLHLIS